MKRIIFLDVDGVLNSINKLIEVYKLTGKSHSCYDYPFDDNCLEYLKYIVEETDAYLVITSTWRKDEEGIEILLNKLREFDLDKRVIGYTPILGTKRFYEIKEYLDTLNEEVNFIILDDDSDMLEFSKNLIKTTTQVGLTKEQSEQAILKLKRVE